MDELEEVKFTLVTICTTNYQVPLSSESLMSHICVQLAEICGVDYSPNLVKEISKWSGLRTYVFVKGAVEEASSGIYEVLLPKDLQ